METPIKWYQNPHWGTKKDYVKGVIDGTAVKGEEYIHNGTYHKNSVHWSGGCNLREVPLDELQPYLPNGHPDKLIVPLAPLVTATTVTTEAVLKEGNYVEITTSGSYGRTDYSVGEVWKVVKLTTNCDYHTAGIYVQKDGKETQLNLGECKPVRTARFEPEVKLATPKVEESWEPYKDMWVVLTDDYAELKKGELHQLKEPQNDGKYCWYVYKGLYAPYLKKMRPATGDEIHRHLQTKQGEKWIPRVGEWVYDDTSRVCLGLVTKLIDSSVYAKWYDKDGRNLINNGCCPIGIVRKALPHEITVVDAHQIVNINPYKEKDHRVQIPNEFPPIQMKTNKVKHKLLI